MIQSFASDRPCGCDLHRPQASAVLPHSPIRPAGTEPAFICYSLALRIAELNPSGHGRQHTAEGMHTYTRMALRATWPVRTADPQSCSRMELWGLP
jgi:hypothetical protein